MMSPFHLHFDQLFQVLTMSSPMPGASKPVQGPDMQHD